ncbi:MAG: hypothetical protein IJ849_06790 [Selenomonadaceae bacterium]|nr:hypothetical protein [Selenomonadaceae bacterium]
MLKTLPRLDFCRDHREDLAPGYRQFGRRRYLSIPRDIEFELRETDFCHDVLVGALRSRRQFQTALAARFYHLPVTCLSKDDLPIRWIALYQSKAIFRQKSGIRYYGRVTGVQIMPRREITELPKNSGAWYYRFTVAAWQELSPPLAAMEVGVMPLLLTNFFLLRHGAATPELTLNTAEEYRFFYLLRRGVALMAAGEYITLRIREAEVVLKNNYLRLYSGQKLLGARSAGVYYVSPGAVTAYFYRLATAQRS